MSAMYELWWKNDEGRGTRVECIARFPEAWQGRMAADEFATPLQLQCGRFVVTDQAGQEVDQFTGEEVLVA